MTAVNHVMQEVILSGEKKVDVPILSIKQRKNKPALHLYVLHQWRRKRLRKFRESVITADFQAYYQEDFMAHFLNLMELWGWRLGMCS